MEKLYELHQEGNYDLLVLDTPPTRNALDFLDAPQRLARFIDSRSLSSSASPGSSAGPPRPRRRDGLLGDEANDRRRPAASDLSEFFTSFGDMADGFRERAERVDALIADSRTTFILVTSPRATRSRRPALPPPLREGGPAVRRGDREPDARAGRRRAGEEVGASSRAARRKLAGKVAHNSRAITAGWPSATRRTSSGCGRAGPQAADHSARAAWRRARPRRPQAMNEYLFAK